MSWRVLVRPMRGMQAEFEAAMKQHAAWTGMRWKDLDGMASDIMRADAANWNETVGKVAVQTASIVARSMPDVSRPGEGPIAAVRLSHIKVKQGMGGQFVDALRKWHEGRQQGPERYVYSQVVAGAEQPSYLGAVVAASWAEMEPDGSFSLADAMGQDEARAMWQQLTECIESRQTELMTPRPDLAYWLSE